MTKPGTLGELKQAGWTARSIKDEMRENLIAKLRSGEPVFPGVVGYEQTVIPQIVNAILAKHNLILLGLRGQAKTRVLRLLTTLLDDEIPVIAGTELNENPFHPVTTMAREMVEREGENTLISWLPRDARYNEKLATPDVSIADLIGDMDPIKAATRKLSLSNEAAIHYGIIPRTNRGIFAINELPDLQPRIQVGLLNILEEKDIQIRGYPVRLELDIMLCFSANPEDYTNRGSIITPLKDRIESQILTHYPSDMQHSKTITDQEAWVERSGPRVVIPTFLRDAIENIAFEARKSEFVDQASGVSARMNISVIEDVISNAEQRCFRNGTDSTTLRVVDLLAAIPAMSGKLELVYEGEQEGAHNVAIGIVGAGVRSVFEKLFPGAYQTRQRKGRSERESVADREDGPYKSIVDHFASGKRLELSDFSDDKEYAKQLEQVAGLKELVESAGHDEFAEHLPVMMELVLEGLHQSSLIAKQDLDRSVVYSDMLGAMYEELGE